MENMVGDFEKFWFNKKILITGHTGFKGSWLALVLKNFGSKLYGISLKPSLESHYNILKSKNFFKSEFFIDISTKSLSTVLKKIQPDIIFHLAAQPLVIESIKNPLLTYKTNVIGTINLLEAMRNYSMPQVFINVTSDKVYSYNKSENLYFKENSRLGGGDPYSNSKACSELITSSHFHSFFYKHDICISTVRSGNVIGGGDFAKNRIIPDFFRSLKSNKTLIIRNPNHIRPWQHVLDPVFGYLLTAWFIDKNKIKFTNWNFGPNKKSHIKVLDIIKIMSAINDFNNIDISKKKLKSENSLLKLNSSKVKRTMNWKPIWGLQETLVETSKWYNSYMLRNEAISEFQFQNYYKKFLKEIL